MAGDLLLPLLFCGILGWGLLQGVDVFAAFRTGAAKGVSAAPVRKAANTSTP